MMQPAPKVMKKSSMSNIINFLKSKLFIKIIAERLHDRLELILHNTVKV